MKTKVTVKDLLAVFLKLGLISFGGPVAHIAWMERDLVAKKRWISREEFLEAVALTHLIPGPNSTEIAIFIGQRFQGLRGLLVTGAAFIFPAAIFSAALAEFYVRYGQLPRAQGALAGIQPVVAAIILQACLNLGRTSVRSVPAFVLTAVCAAAWTLGLHEVLVLLAAGGITYLASFTSASRPLSISLAALFFLFLKIGAILYGSGYILFAYLKTDLVERLGWMTEPQLLDAIAAGQSTPGPLFSTATFVGYFLAGVPGAVVATVAIFLPAFLFVAVLAKWLPTFQKSFAVKRFLDGVAIASVAMMFAVCGELFLKSRENIFFLSVAAISFVILWLWRWKHSPIIVLALGCGLGLLRSILA